MPSVRAIRPFALLSLAALMEAGCRRAPTESWAVWDPTASIEAQLESPGEHRYQLRFERASVVELQAEQQGIDVELRLEDEDGVLAVQNWAFGRLGRERVLFVAPAGASFRLRVKAAPPDGESGRYRLSATSSPSPRAFAHARTWLAAQAALQRADRRDPSDRVPAETWPTLRRAAAEHEDAWLQAKLQLYEAGHAYLQGAYDEAAMGYQRADRAFAAVSDRMGRARALRGLGNVRNRQGDYAGAIEATRASLELGQAIADLREQAGARLNLGIQLDQLGRYRESLPNYREAIVLFARQREPFGEELAQRGLAACYRRLGEAQLALEHAERAKRLALEHGFEANLAGYHSSVAQVHLELLDDPQTALAHYRRSTAMLREQEDDFFLAQDLDAMGLAYQQLGELGRAAQLSSEALDIARAQRVASLEGQILWSLGRAERRLGHEKAAREHLERGVQLNTHRGIRRYAALARAELAALELQQGHLPTAERSILDAIQTWEALRAEVVLPELRRSYAATFRRFHDLYVRILLARDRPTEALVASESGRSRALLEAIEQGEDPPWAEAAPVQAALDELRSAELRFGRALESEAPNARVQAEAALGTAREQLGLAHAAWMARHPEVAARWQPPALDPKALRAGLPKQAQLLAFHLGEEASGVWRLTRDHLEHLELPSRAELERLARALHEHTAKEEAETTSRAAATRLATTLLAPADTDHPLLLIVADGALGLVPWAALPHPETGRPLVATHTIVQAPAARLLTRSAPLGPTSKAKVAVFADPVFESDDPRLAPAGGEPLDSPRWAAALRAAGERWVRIPFSHHEAKAIEAAGSDVELHLGLDANEATLRSALEASSILHLAVHGWMNATRPSLSGLVLSLFDASGKPRDGFLRSYEIARLALDGQLVVLSACQTAIGRSIRGEGLQGLTRAFLQAGARDVIASLWKVDDRATAELMKRFYRHLLQGHRAPAEALRLAQNELRAEPRWSNPYHWSGFVLQTGYGLEGHP